MCVELGGEISGYAWVREWGDGWGSDVLLPSLRVRSSGGL